MVFTPRIEQRKSAGAAAANNFEQDTKSIWAEPNVDKKREILTSMITNFLYKKKVDEFLAKVRNAKSGAQLDYLATQIMLYGDGLSVLK